MSTVAVLFLAMCLGLAGCAGPRLDLAQIPQRDADLYPWAQKRSGVAVVVDEVADPVRVKRYFGVDLLSEGILPVFIIVSNRSDRRITIRPADILLVRGRRVVDPLPTGQVANAVQRELGARRGESARDVERYFAGVALRETTLTTNESYQGVLFFPRPQPERDRNGEGLLSILGLFERGPRMNVGVTDAETGERLHFGPFRVSAPEDGRRGFFDASGWRSY